MKNITGKTISWALLSVLCAASAFWLVKAEPVDTQPTEVAQIELMTIGYGDVDDPCTVQVDPSTYDELVKMGILDWVEACNASQQ